MLKSGYSSIQAQIAVFLLSAFFHEVYYVYFKAGWVFYRLKALLERESFSSLPNETLLVFALLWGQLLSKVLFCFLLCLFVFLLSVEVVSFLLSVRKKKTFWEYGRKSRTLKKTNIEIRAWPMGKSSSHTGADPGFFSGGGALVSCSTSTPINHIYFFFLAEYQLHPLHPPPRSAPVTFCLHGATSCSS